MNVLSNRPVIEAAGKSPPSVLAGHSAVVLCGGRGSRMGKLTDERPKSMVEVHGKPLIWYVIMTLYMQGFRHIVLPLGYKGAMIEGYVREHLGWLDCTVRFVDTGEDTPIAGRLAQLLSRGMLRADADFFLANGDTYFDFDIADMLRHHRDANAEVTLSSVEVASQYGLILETGGKVTGFGRDSRIAAMTVRDAPGTEGYVNAGLAWINAKALSRIDLARCENFEQSLYPLAIAEGKAARYPVDGAWVALDTAKDVARINQMAGLVDRLVDDVESRRRDLTTRYSYKTRYFDDPAALREQIMSKTVIPHQVEIQPGPVGTRALCWMKCPYCYGGSSDNTGERLDPDRYVEIMKQIAAGGVKKVIFAGYATDPLNYRNIEDLVQVAVDNRQVFGFHTKAIKVSDRLVELLAQPDNAPLSYFSVSVDAGSNAVYNTVHGVGASKAPIYDRVMANIRRLADARAASGAPFDISTTYLVNSHNNATAEVEQAIADCRAAGSDLIRFTFPQVPRGYEAEADENVPSREEVEEYMARLTPVVEAASSDDFQALILDLDKDYDIDRKPRTLPCFARFVFPCIGFDGHLSHCSESAAPHFREMAFGDLNSRDFWDLFYDYSVEDFTGYLRDSAKQMCKLNCKCDRKEHVVNSTLSASGAFSDFT